MRRNAANTTETTLFKETFRQIRNAVVSKIKKEKRASLQEKIESSSNENEIWNYAKSIYKPKDTEAITLMENGKEQNDTATVA